MSGSFTQTKDDGKQMHCVQKGCESFATGWDAMTTSMRDDLLSWDKRGGGEKGCKMCSTWEAHELHEKQIIALCFCAKRKRGGGKKRKGRRRDAWGDMEVGGMRRREGLTQLEVLHHLWIYPPERKRKQCNTGDLQRQMKRSEWNYRRGNY